MTENSIAVSFVRARRGAEGLPEYPGAMPGTLDEAYRIQAAAIDLSGAPVAGWKIGRIQAPYDEASGANRLAGPIFADSIVLAGRDGNVAMPVFAAGFGAAEAEFLLKLGGPVDPAKRRYSMDEVAALIGAVHVGIEIASSPFPGINDHGPAVTISDFGNNNGLIVGPEIDGWRDAAIESWPVSVEIDGQVIARGTAATMLDGPVGAARFLLELAAERGIPLREGCWISSGAVTGVHAVRPGATVVARFGPDLRLGCTITEAQPQVA